jgi:DNA-binding LacI/PurR family transcriptional regulator
MKQGYEQVASVLTPQTTALVCATDTLALGASNICRSSVSITCRWRASAARR